MKHTIIDASQFELEEKVVSIKRVTKVVKGGRNFRFTALVVVGDGNGHVGAGLGKAAEIPEAIRKGKEDAMKKLVSVAINENGSITHDYVGKFGSAEVLLKKAPEGTGVIAGGPARAVIELAGIKNIRTKSLGSNNKQNVVLATITGLSQLKTPEEVAKLRENADELEVKSSVSGTIASISASAGKSIGGEEQPLATINVTDRGFTVKIDVTNDQAKKVKTGDTAELVNFWGGDAVATLDQITSSQTAGNRTLVFTLTGDIQAGQNVTLSIGQKSANYDALIPLSGLREDSNGKFVYVLESKSSPLGSRYIATRGTVQELARDDKSAAVSGISSGDFIITTSNKPVEAGKQVRLADNG